MCQVFALNFSYESSHCRSNPTKPYMAQGLKIDQSSIVSALSVQSCRLDTLQFPFIKQCHQLGPQKHAFSEAVPALWNEAPPNIQTAPTLKWPWRWGSSPGPLVRMTFFPPSSHLVSFLCHLCSFVLFLCFCIVTCFKCFLTIVDCPELLAVEQYLSNYY